MCNMKCDAGSEPRTARSHNATSVTTARSMSSSESQPSHPSFNIRKTTRITEEKLQSFISSPVNDSLQSVPGIGAKTEQVLQANGVMCTTQLIGVFLTYKRPEHTTQQHMDAFYGFLRDIKAMIPGMFNARDVAFGSEPCCV